MIHTQAPCEVSTSQTWSLPDKQDAEPRGWLSVLQSAGIHICPESNDMKWPIDAHLIQKHSPEAQYLPNQKACGGLQCFTHRCWCNKAANSEKRAHNLPSCSGVTALINGEKSVSAQHYNFTVELTCDLCQKSKLACKFLSYGFKICLIDVWTSVYNCI